MTMPFERMRALCWAYELLHDVCSGATVSDDERRRAERLLETFPAPPRLRVLLEERAALPQDAAAAIEAAGLFLGQLRRSDCLAADRKRQIDWVLRHYPESGEAQLWAEAPLAGALGEWLMTEDPYGRR